MSSRGTESRAPLEDGAYSVDWTPPVDYDPEPLADPPRASLTEIADHYKTDKGTIRHGYTAIYEMYLEPLRTRQGLRLLEVGVACGASLKTWSVYFQDASIVGVDIREECRKLCRQFPKIEIRICDARREPQAGSFDVIVDDGSHISADIVEIFRTNWPSLKPGGYYFIEDLKCTHNPLYPRQLAQQAEPARFARRHFMEFVDDELMRLDWGQSAVEYMHFYPELLVLKKTDQPGSEPLQRWKHRLFDRYRRFRAAVG